MKKRRLFAINDDFTEKVDLKTGQGNGSSGKRTLTTPLFAVTLLLALGLPALGLVQ